MRRPGSGVGGTSGAALPGSEQEWLAREAVAWLLDGHLQTGSEVELLARLGGQRGAEELVLADGRTFALGEGLSMAPEAAAGIARPVRTCTSRYQSPLIKNPSSGRRGIRASIINL